MTLSLSEKLAILADAAKYDASCASSGAKGTRETRPGLGSTTGVGICHSYTPDGRCVSLLKILLTNYCIYDCTFCVNRISSGVQRARFSIEDVVDLTIEFYKRNYIEGLFLSSGIIQSSDYTMEQLIEVARRLREEQSFRGYVHLKTIAGASPELIDKAGLYADRLSVNIELPTEADLKALAPEKKRTQIDASMHEIRARRDQAKADQQRGFRAPVFAPAGQSTQLIVGATPSEDASILRTSNELYARHRLKRVYYSAFSPIPHADARLPAKAPPLVREHRLYQADWLLRFYGFSVDELTTASEPNLRLDIDPKTAWALRHPDLFPIDLNTAPKEVLLRVPGLGIRNVTRLLELRRFKSIRRSDLVKLRVPLRRAAPFVTTGDAGHRNLEREMAAFLESLRSPSRQLQLFE